MSLLIQWDHAVTISRPHIFLFKPESWSEQARAGFRAQKWHSLIPIHRVRVYPISDPFRIRVSQPSIYCKMNYVQCVFNEVLKYHTKILSRNLVYDAVKDGIFERHFA